MALTQGEKMVWAAAFAKAINESSRIEAARRAGAAVDALRKNAEEMFLDDIIGKDYAQMLRTVLEDE